MKVIEAPVYRSDDGLREFKSQDECIEYEKFILLRAIIHKHARGIVYQAEVANFILKAWSEISLAMQHNGEACAIESALQPGWRDIESAPKDGSSYLVADAERGFVAPHIRGVIHNNPGTNWDWQYGEAVTHWMPLPPAPKATK